MGPAATPIGQQQQNVPIQGEIPHDLVIQTIHPLIQTLEDLMGHPVLTYFLDEGAAIADEQMLHLYEHLRRVGKRPQISLWLNSRGGATEVPWKIVPLIREYATKFSVLIPYRAHSAATHIAMGADEIVMTEMSELGPVDPSRHHPLLPQEEKAGGVKERIPISVQDLRHVLEFLKRELGEALTPEAGAQVYTALFDKVHPLAIGALEQSWSLARQISEHVLATHMNAEGDKEKIATIVDRLSDYYQSHLYQISREEAKAIGLKVRNASDEECSAIWDLYVAYTKINIGGEGEIDGQPAIVRRLGHMDSLVGSTIGLGLTPRARQTPQPAPQQISQWASKWLAGVAAPQVLQQ